MDKQVEGTESGSFDGKSKDDEKHNPQGPNQGVEKVNNARPTKSVLYKVLPSAASEPLTWTRSPSLPLPGSRHGLSAGG